MVANHVTPGRRHEGGELGDEVDRFENDVSGPVPIAVTQAGDDGVRRNAEHDLKNQFKR